MNNDASPPAPVLRVPVSVALALTAQAGAQLFANGQTTERTTSAAQRLAVALGFQADVFPRWGELLVHIDDDGCPHDKIVAATPADVDMGKVTATLNAINQLRSGCISAEAARTSLDAAGQLPPVSLARFVLMAAAGAAALAVIFGATHLLSLVLIALSAGAGAYLRRWLAGASRNPFVQPLCAALLAGTVGAILVRFQVTTALRFVMVCPCLVLVPGPHLLNGAIDLARGRVVLGTARMVYASLIILMICAGLLMGIALCGATLPVSPPSIPVPLGYDVIAAGVAVAAYGTFFAMPWRMLPIPILLGMLAHAARWAMIALAGAGVEISTLVACLIVGIIATPVTDRMPLPFAAIAFASVVPLMPGVFLFRMASGLVDLAALGDKAPPALLTGTIADCATASLVLLAMAFGLILPKLCIDGFKLTRGNHWESAT